MLTTLTQIQPEPLRIRTPTRDDLTQPLGPVRLEHTRKQPRSEFDNIPFLIPVIELPIDQVQFIFKRVSVILKIVVSVAQIAK